VVKKNKARCENPAAVTTTLLLQQQGLAQEGEGMDSPDLLLGLGWRSSPDPPGICREGGEVGDDRGLDHREDDDGSHRPFGVDPCALVDASSGQADRPPSFAADVAEGRSRAQAVLDRFRRQLLPPGRDAGKDAFASGGASTDALGQASCASVEAFVEQRRKGLEREARLRGEFLRKNLEHVARRERDRARRLAAEIEACKDQQDRVRRQHEQALRERQRLQRGARVLERASQAAVGSRERRGAERLKSEPLYGRGAPRGHADAEPAPSPEVYLSGIPVDGTVGEAFLRKLFEPYGAVRKVHFYRDKVRGQLKGDALVVFQNDDGGGGGGAAASPRGRLATVCSEVRRSGGAACCLGSRAADGSQADGLGARRRRPAYRYALLTS
jgi:hypothetical protein